MAAATVIVKAVQTIRLANAVGRAIIIELFRMPAATAADTQTLVSKSISEVLGVIGNVTYTAITPTEAGVSIPVTYTDTVPASNFTDIIVIGYERKDISN